MQAIVGAGNRPCHRPRVWCVARSVREDPPRIVRQEELLPFRVLLVNERTDGMRNARSGLLCFISCLRLITKITKINNYYYETDDTPTDHVQSL